MGGWALIAGGVVAAPFTGGASLAAVPLGAQMLSGEAQKEAAKKAETQLTAAGDKALATQEVAARQNIAAFQPYTQTGSAAMSALGNYMGLPNFGTVGQGPLASGFTGGVQTQAGGVPVPLGDLPAGAQQAVGVRAPSPPTPTGQAVARTPAAAATVQTQAAQQNASGYTPLGGVGASGLVQMRAPTGQTQWVPRSQAPFYAQRGAVEVG